MSSQRKETNNKRSNYLPYLFSDYINGIGYQTVNSLSKKKRPIDSDDIFLMKFVKDAKEIVVDRKVKEMQQLNLLIKKRHAEVEIDKKMAENSTHKTTNLNNEESGKKHNSDNSPDDHKSDKRLPRRTYKNQPDAKNIKTTISKYLNVSSQPTMNRQVTKERGNLIINVMKKDVNGTSGGPLSGFVPPRPINDQKHQSHQKNFKSRNDEHRRALEDNNYSRSKSQPRSKEVPKNFEKEVKADGYKSDGEGLESFKNYNGTSSRTKRGRIFYGNNPRHTEASKELTHNFKSTEDVEAREGNKKHQMNMHKRVDNDKRDSNRRGRGFGRENHRNDKRHEVNRGEGEEFGRRGRGHNDMMKSSQATNENQQEDLRNMLNERYESKRGSGHKNKRGRGSAYAGGDAPILDQKHETKSVKKDFPKSFDKVDGKGDNKYRKDNRKKENFQRAPRRSFDEEDRASATTDFRKNFTKDTDGESFCQKYTFKSGKQVSDKSVEFPAKPEISAQATQKLTSINEVSQSNPNHQKSVGDSFESSLVTSKEISDSSQKIEGATENKIEEKDLSKRENEGSKENIAIKKDEDNKANKAKKEDKSEIKEIDKKQDELKEDYVDKKEDEVKNDDICVKKDELKNAENKDVTQSNNVMVSSPTNEDSSSKLHVDQKTTNDTKNMIETALTLTEVSEEVKQNNQEIIENVEKIESAGENVVVADKWEDRLSSENQTHRATTNGSAEALLNEEKNNDAENKRDDVVTKDDVNKTEAVNGNNDGNKKDGSEKKEDAKTDDTGIEDIHDKDDSKKDQETEKIATLSESNVDFTQKDDAEGENKTSTQNEAITGDTKESAVETDNSEIKKELQRDVAHDKVDSTQNSSGKLINSDKKATFDGASSQEPNENNEQNKLTAENNEEDKESKDVTQVNDALKNDSEKLDTIPNVQEATPTSVTSETVADESGAADGDKKIDA